MPTISHFMARAAQRLRDLAGLPTALAPAAGRFVMGVNLGGPPVTVQGQSWQGFEAALAAGLQAPGVRTATSGLVPVPYADPQVRQMLNTVVFRPRQLEIQLPLPAGRYALYLWVMENYESQWHSMVLRVAGQEADRHVGELALGEWRRCGPYGVASTGEGVSLVLDTGRREIDAHLMGISVHETGA